MKMNSIVSSSNQEDPPTKPSDRIKGKAIQWMAQIKDAEKPRKSTFNPKNRMHTNLVYKDTIRDAALLHLFGLFSYFS